MKNSVKVPLFIAILIFFYVLIDYFYGVSFIRFLSIVTTLSVIFIAFVIFLENRHPANTLTWLVVLGGFPIAGFFFYLLFGRNHRKEKIFKEKYYLDKQAIVTVEEHAEQKGKRIIDQLPDDERKLFRLSQKLGNFPISFQTDTKVLTNGEETFSHIIDALNKATHHIHLEYYIVRHDQIGSKIKDLLIRKAKAGVKVRFLYDAVGSWKLSRKYIRDMKKAGIQAVPFGPVKFPFLNNKVNFRNHRKIVIVDGRIGFVGGLNIGDEYLGKHKFFGHWRDTHLQITGEAIRSLQMIFLQDWFYMTGENLVTAEYLSPPFIEESKGGVQLIAGGPDNEWSAIKSVFFSMITSAKKSIWIASPYFIPDEDILTALKIASLSGVDVRLLIPNKADKKIVFFASRSYFPELLEVGVKIYGYDKGFLHSKIIIVDESIASIGSSNMDMRSFHLNFEVNAFLYKTESIKKLVNDFLNDFNDSTEIQLSSFQQRSIGKRMVESLCRLLSPLL